MKFICNRLTRAPSGSRMCQTPDTTEKRAYPRSQNETSIVYAPYRTKKYHGAKMYNCSKGGINMVLNRPIQPGTDVCIKEENASPDSPHQDGFRAEVIWCKDVSDVYASYYGKYEAGLAYYEPFAS